MRKGKLGLHLMMMILIIDFHSMFFGSLTQFPISNVCVFACACCVKMKDGTLCEFVSVNGTGIGNGRGKGNECGK